MPNHTIKNVTFFGGAEVDEDSKLFQDAFQVAKVLAQHDYTIIDGGGPGVMLAATNGAESVNGDTMSVTLTSQFAPGFEGKYIKNITDKEIKTPDYTRRIHGLIEHGDCYVIFQGGTGTLSELGMVWCLARLYYPHHKPFILYGDFWQDIIDSMNKNLLMRKHEQDVYRIANSPEAVIKAIEEFDAEFQSVDHKNCNICAESAYMR